MKKAVFVFHPSDLRESFEHPWKRPGGMLYNTRDMEFEPGKGMVLFRRDFKAGEGVRRVVVRSSALGIFELYLNGRRVGRKTGGGRVFDELKPTWTDYRSRVFEFEYDITDMCAENNTIVAEVSAGWWSGRISFGMYGFRPCAFCGEIEIEYDDGRSELLADGWQTAIGGRVRRADIWDGEYYDARYPDPSTEPDKYDWMRAYEIGDVECETVKPVGGLVRVRADLERQPQSAVCYREIENDGSDFGVIKTTRKRIGERCESGALHAGEKLILDFGQNMVGRPRIFVRAKSGTVIKGLFAELLNDSGSALRGNDGPRGSLYVKNYRSALSRMTYVALGSGTEEYAPLHTFYGFRYLELTADGDIEIEKITGEVLTSVERETGFIETDNPEVNRLISNIMWGLRGNYLSVPSDCPQRDERLGWTGDTQIFCGAACYLSDSRDFLKKWLGDARDSQRGEDGAYCDVIPRVFRGHNANAAWGDAGVIVPWRLWLMYRDYETVAEHYDSMEEYMRHLEQYGLEGPNTAYGDWLNYEKTDKRYIAVCYYAYDADLMIKFSRILGKADRERYYTELRRKIGEHFAQRYIENGGLTHKTQTAYLLALRFNLIPEEIKEKTIRELEQKIKDNNYTLSTGFVGTGILNQTLSDLGLDNLCYSLLLQTADPSWLYSVRQGATTIWERWNSYTIERGFGDVAMNSFNHYAYGAVAEWMFAKMAGISPDEEHPGFERFVLCPRPDMRREDEIPEGQTKIRRVRAHYDSPRGKIESGWYAKGDGFVYEFTVPSGTSARVELCAPGADVIRINDVVFTLDELRGRSCDGYVIFELRGGKYTVKPEKI